MYGALREDLAVRLAEVREAGLYKSELLMTTPQGPHVGVGGRELLNLCANDYLGLAGHPATKLDEICDLAERHDALVTVDDSQSVGVVGEGGRETPEHFGVTDRVDVVTGTLGKAIGGASGGYVSGRAEIVELLRRRARLYLFSNSVAPPVVGASLRALELIEGSADLRDRLRENTAFFRTRMTDLGFDVLPGSHPIVPVIVGDEVAAARLSEKLVELGVYAVSFSYPVVPRGTARIRTQVSAAHTRGDLEFAAARFAEARDAVAQ